MTRRSPDWEPALLTSVRVIRCPRADRPVLTDYKERCWMVRIRWAGGWVSWVGTDIALSLKLDIVITGTAGATGLSVGWHVGDEWVGDAAVAWPVGNMTVGDNFAYLDPKGPFWPVYRPTTDVGRINPQNWTVADYVPAPNPDR